MQAIGIHKGYDPEIDSNTFAAVNEEMINQLLGWVHNWKLSLSNAQEIQLDQKKLIHQLES